MSIKSVMISCVESQYTQEYIANVFWRQHIAKVGSITLIPYLKNGQICSIAYIAIDEWCDSEAAYNFIQRLKDSSREVRIVHHDDEWWPVEINTHNNGEIYVGAYTMAFMSDYFVRDEQDEQDDATAPCSEVDATAPCSEVDDEEWCEFDQQYPILVRGGRYTVEEAKGQLRQLKTELATAYRHRETDEDLEEIEAEIASFEAELRIHEIINNSQNVTLREKQHPRWELVHPEDNGGRREIACSNMC
jgi:hypothetical protein